MSTTQLPGHREQLHYTVVNIDKTDGRESTYYLFGTITLQRLAWDIYLLQTLGSLISCVKILWHIT